VPGICFFRSPSVLLAGSVFLSFTSFPVVLIVFWLVQAAFVTRIFFEKKNYDYFFEKKRGGGEEEVRGGGQGEKMKE